MTCKGHSQDIAFSDVGFYDFIIRFYDITISLVIVFVGILMSSTHPGVSYSNSGQCDQKKSPNVDKSCPKMISLEK